GVGVARLEVNPAAGVQAVDRVDGGGDGDRLAELHRVGHRGSEADGRRRLVDRLGQTQRVARVEAGEVAVVDRRDGVLADAQGLQVGRRIEDGNAAGVRGGRRHGYRGVAHAVDRERDR